MSILFVVHRGAPFPGGSEVYVHNMAVEAKSRGHSVTVLAGMHQGQYQDIEYTSNFQQVLNQKWDLIVVHGCDTNSMQDLVLQNVKQIKSPVLYLIIKPSRSITAIHGLLHSNFVGYSTTADLEFAKPIIGRQRLRRIRHGIPLSTRFLPTETKMSRYIMSAGGFYPHKGMIELAETFTQANLPDVQLHLYGYADGPTPQETDKIKIFKNQPIHMVHNAMVNAALYVMNSTEEGFGLVLLEAMINKTPWLARDIAGAHDLKRYGTTYSHPGELSFQLRQHLIDDSIRNEIVQNGFDFVMQNHTIKQTIDDIEDILLNK